MPLEIEKKFLDPDFDSVRKILINIGAVNGGTHFEHNEVFDNREHDLLKSGSLLRIRVRKWRDHEDAILTFKSAVPTQSSAKGLKVREEQELGIGKASAMALILEKIGFSRIAVYEKFRQSWTLTTPENPSRKIHVDLDSLPFCRVIEIEGEPGEISGLAGKLGLDRLETSSESYHELHQKWRAGHNLPPDPSFSFDDEIYPAKFRTPPDKDFFCK